MSTRQIFKEVISQKLSPIVLTGSASALREKFEEFLGKAYPPDDYMLLDTVNSETVKSLKALLTLCTADLKCIVISSSGVTPSAWQKLLKVLEDCAPSTQVIFISDGSIPKTIETRSFRCHIPPQESETTNYSGTAAFSVGSWLISVDVKNREQLLKSCQEWTVEHTELLIDELNEQLLGSSILLLSLDKRLADPNRLIAAIYLLNENKAALTAPIYTGLRLMA